MSTPADESTLTADVLIVGVGPAGAVAARVLAASHSVIVVDREAVPPFRIGESLPGAAARLLRDLGLLDSFAAGGHRPSLGQASAWGSDRLIRRDAFLDPDGPGWRIDRAAFETMLRQGAEERGANLIAPAKLAQLDRDGDGWIARVESDAGVRSVRARFVMDASGRAASVARAGGGLLVAGDRLVCRYVRLPCEAPNKLDNVLTVEAVPDGWWYGAVLPDGGRLLAFHTDADLPAARISRDAAGFRHLLRETRWVNTLGANGLNAPIASASARSQWLAAPSGADWCAVGDAALAFDPLAGQGLFNALYTGLRGAQAVAAALAGDGSRLAAYGERVTAIRDAYRRNLASYYVMETRFADRPFWLRRQPVAGPHLLGSAGVGAMHGALA
jgi:flavin-dependent dehydrogenase